jgi:alkanesulfonate monooxygenase SsuD/methylene tetrahydromethanopterin reductase-like flavin-dependent oxidoreductase (luciferase family)
MRAIRVGIFVPQVQLRWDDMLDRARRCDELGFDSFWMYDHLIAPGAPDKDGFEGWTLASALLACTSRLRIGHMVTCAAFRHPVLLGKMASTMDVISGGRLNFGIGSGSNESEHGLAGIPWNTLAYRTEILEETLAIVTHMFEHDVTTFEGKHFQVHDFPNHPRPVQRPRPPVYVGGVSEKRTLPLVARFADVWNVPTYGLAALAEKSAVLDELCAAIGRDPTTIRRSLEAVMVIAPTERELDEAKALGQRRFGHPGFGLEAGGYIGTPNAIVDRIGQHVELGFREFAFFLHDRARPATLELIAERVLPQL